MGEATARLPASLGADVALLDVEVARAERVKSEIERFGVRYVASYITGQTLAVDGGYMAAGGFGNTLPAPQGQTKGLEA
jgi:hypothetical protein